MSRLQVISEEEVPDEATAQDNVESESITSSVYDYVFENGRRYHSFRQGSYPLPNDEAEQERLGLCHIIWSTLLKDRVFMAPIQNPQKILDIGCGTGKWAIAIGTMFPAASVIGTDLSPIQPSWVPPNVKFYIEDAEDEWSFEKGYDLVHGRMLAGSIGNWTRFFQRAFGQLKPGGWLEMNEFEAKFFYNNEDNEESTQLNMLVEVFNKASATFGKCFNDVLILPQAMRNAGFVDIEWKVTKVPIGTWHRSTKMKELGQTALVAATESIESYILAIGTRIMEDPAESIRDIVRATKESLNNEEYELYARAHIIWGRRPKYN